MEERGRGVKEREAMSALVRDDVSLSLSLFCLREVRDERCPHTQIHTHTNTHIHSQICIHTHHIHAHRATASLSFSFLSPLLLHFSLDCPSEPSPLLSLPHPVPESENICLSSCALSRSNGQREKKTGSGFSGSTATSIVSPLPFLSFPPCPFALRPVPSLSFPPFRLWQSTPSCSSAPFCSTSCWRPSRPGS